MEKSNFVVNGGIKLPIGYRFHPTDEELIVHYLRRKIIGVPLPASVIPELDVFQADPWSLPGDLKENRYFFGRRWGNDTQNRSKIAAGSGYWKSVGKSRPIITSFSNHIVGIRRTLIFCQGKHSDDSKTQWVMREYSLIGIQVSKMNLGEWVVHRIFQRRRRPKKQEIINSRSSNVHDIINSKFMEFTAEESSDAAPPQPSSPCSSGITEVSSAGLDQEEITSSISFSFHSCMRKSN